MKGWPRLALTAAVAAVALFPATVAGAQDRVVPHAWIMDDQNYRQDPDENGTRSGCCGASHCRPAAPGEIVKRPDGGVLHVPTGTVLPPTSKAIYLTADPERRDFICVIGGKLVCAALKGEG